MVCRLGRESAVPTGLAVTGVVTQPGSTTVGGRRSRSLGRELEPSCHWADFANLDAVDEDLADLWELEAEGKMDRRLRPAPRRQRTSTPGLRSRFQGMEEVLALRAGPDPEDVHKIGSRFAVVDLDTATANRARLSHSA